MPSRFVGELPEAHVEMIADEGMYGGYGGFRDNSGGNFGSTYDSPGWRRAQAARGANPLRRRTRAPPADFRKVPRANMAAAAHARP